MKKLMACILAVGMMAGIAGAQEVLSRNAVGYVKVEVPAASLKMVSTPFVNFDGEDQTIDEVFGVVPDDSELHVWDPILQSYAAYTYADWAGGWIDGIGNTAGDTPFPRGQGAWFRNVSSSEHELYFIGEVPDALLNETDVPMVLGLSMAAFAYPVQITLNDPDANLNPIDDDEVHRWDPGSQSYSSYTYAEWAGGWIDGSGNPAVITSAPGDAFWYKSGADQTWEQERPYTWP